MDSQLIHAFSIMDLPNLAVLSLEIASDKSYQYHQADIFIQTHTTTHHEAHVTSPPSHSTSIFTFPTAIFTCTSISDLGFFLPRVSQGLAVV